MANETTVRAWPARRGSQRRPDRRPCAAARCCLSARSDCARDALLTLGPSRSKALPPLKGRPRGKRLSMSTARPRPDPHAPVRAGRRPSASVWRTPFVPRNSRQPHPLSILRAVDSRRRPSTARSDQLLASLRSPRLAVAQKFDRCRLQWQTRSRDAVSAGGKALKSRPLLRRLGYCTAATCLEMSNLWPPPQTPEMVGECNARFSGTFVDNHTLLGDGYVELIT